MTKHEKKLLKAAKKLEKATKKYMKSLTEVDKVMQKLPTQVTRCYSMDERYFNHVPTLAGASVKMELLYSILNRDIQNTIHENNDWDKIAGETWNDLMDNSLPSEKLDIFEPDNEEF